MTRRNALTEMYKGALKGPHIEDGGLITGLLLRNLNQVTIIQIPY